MVCVIIDYVMHVRAQLRNCAFFAATLSARRSSGQEGSREESEVRRSPWPPFLSGCGGDSGPVGPAVFRLSEGAGPAAQ